MNLLSPKQRVLKSRSATWRRIEIQSPLACQPAYRGPFPSRHVDTTTSTVCGCCGDLAEEGHFSWDRDLRDMVCDDCRGQLHSAAKVLEAASLVPVFRGPFPKGSKG